MHVTSRVSYTASLALYCALGTSLLLALATEATPDPETLACAFECREQMEPFDCMRECMAGTAVQQDDFRGQEPSKRAALFARLGKRRSFFNRVGRMSMFNRLGKRSVLSDGM